MSVDLGGNNMDINISPLLSDLEEGAELFCVSLRLYAVTGRQDLAAKQTGFGRDKLVK